MKVEKITPYKSSLSRELYDRVQLFNITTESKFVLYRLKEKLWLIETGKETIHCFDRESDLLNWLDKGAK